MPINPSPAVQRAGVILWYLAEHPSETHTVAALSRTLDIPRATCDSILQALTAEGFVSRRPTGYALGVSCLALAGAAQAANPALSVTNRRADQLARDLSACVVVSAIIAEEIRSVAVFDRSSSSALRGRVGQAIPVVPPFGVAFVAWDQALAREWVRAGNVAPDSPEAQRWLQSLEFARRHGYTYSVYAQPGRQFGRVMDELVVAPDSEQNRQSRDELAEQLRQSDYLATDLSPDDEVQLIQVSAPVFGPDGGVEATMMVLGPVRPMRGAEVEELGRAVVAAASEATTGAREIRFGGSAGY